MSIGDSSFGFLNEGKGNTINSNVANQTLGMMEHISIQVIEQEL